jgi:hypothetical protein
MSTMSELQHASLDKTKRNECLKTRIEKVIHDVRFHLDYTDEESEFDKENLFIILKYL